MNGKLMDDARAIVAPIVTILTVSTTLYLLIASRSVPPELWVLVTSIISFWFGLRARTPPPPP